MIRQILFLAALFSCSWNLQAQDPIFTQFYSTPLMMNPAFAGNTYAPRIALNYRNEWPAVSTDGSFAFVTYAASYEQFLPALNSGLGISIMSDDAGGGLYKITNFSANYAYRVQVNDEFNLKLGVDVGFRQINLDWDRFVFLDQLDEIHGAVDPAGNPNISQEQRPEVTNKTYFDVGAGILAYGKSFYGGVSLKHLTTPDESILGINSGLNEGLAMRISAHGGAQFVLSEGNRKSPEVFVSPNIMYIKQGDQGQVNVGSYMGIGPVFFGAWYRHAFGNADAIIPLIGYQYQVFKIGYSYDITVSSLSGAPSGGSHEISLVLNFDNSEKLKRQRFNDRYNDCFKLFR